MSTPKVTVLMVTYNHEPYIAQAIEGVLMQVASFDYRLVVIDDCSTDGTREILREYATRHPETIRLRVAESNRNDNWLFVEELHSTYSPYVATLDGDDYWTAPDKLQKQVDFLDGRPEYTICFHNVMTHHEDDDLPPHPFNPPHQKTCSTVEDMWRWNFIPGCSPLLRRAAVPVLPPWYVSIRWADWALYLLYAEQGLVGYLPEPMGVYRKHRGGMWTGLSTIEQHKTIIAFYQEMNRHLGYRYDSIVRHRLARWHFKLARVYADAGGRAEARRYALRCLAAFRHHRDVRRRHLAGLLYKAFVPRLGS